MNRSFFTPWLFPSILFLHCLPAQETVSLVPVEKTGMEGLHFGRGAYGRVLAPPGQGRPDGPPPLMLPVTGVRPSLTLEGQDLVLAAGGSNRKQCLGKETDLVLGPRDAPLPLHLVPFATPCVDELRPKTPIGRSWLVYRTDGMRGEYRGHGFLLFDSDLNGAFTDIGTDRILIGYSTVPLLLGKVLSLGGDLYEPVPGADGKSLALKPYGGPKGTIDPVGCCQLPIKPTWVVVASADGGEFLAEGSQGPITVPAGSYYFRHALLGSTLEALACDALPPGWGRPGRKEGAGPEFTIAAPKGPDTRQHSSSDRREWNVPSWGAPLRLHLMGQGFADLEAPAGTSSSSQSRRGSWLIIQIDRILVRGTWGEVYDDARAGPAARLGEVFPFGSAPFAIHTLDGRGKKTKKQRWVFADRGPFLSKPSTRLDTRSVTAEVKLPLFGPLERTVPIAE